MTDEHIALDVLRAKLEETEERLREASEETHTTEELIHLEMDAEDAFARLEAEERRRCSGYKGRVLYVASTSKGGEVDHATEDGKKTLCGCSVHYPSKEPFRTDAPFICKRCSGIADAPRSS